MFVRFLSAIIIIMERKLSIELIPDGSWGYNLRSVLPKNLWDIVRKDAVKEANGKCMICGTPSKRLEAHERWSFDTKTSVQKLVGVIAVCPMCHKAIHMERSHLFENAEAVEDWYMKVNGCSYADMRKDMGEANKLQKERNKVSEWFLDLSYLKKFCK